MVRWLLGLLALVSTPVLAQEVPQIAYESVPNFLKLPPDVYLGEAAGVAVNSKGHVFVFSRGGSSQGPAFANTAAQLYEFGPDGKFIREIGKNLYAWAFAHTVRVDKDDNIWATDKGSDMVVKFNPQGRVVMVFGRKPEASDTEAKPYERTGAPPAHVDGRFRQPTDVTWDPAGNIFISDGYVNSRVAKYDKDGNWVKSWGERGTGPSQFNTVHSIAADAQGTLYVADRANRRIQVFDSDGNFKREFKIDVPFDEKTARMAIGNKPDLTNYLKTGGTFTPGAPWALCITPPPNQVLYAADAYPGRIYKLSLDGKTLGVLGETGKQLKQFGWVHEIACPSENVLFVAEVLNWRVQKLLLKPGPQTSASGH
jgi:sugar lactone lactonase YvrE